MIEETCAQIDRLAQMHEEDRRQRYARRDRIRLIDELLDEFEQLNLAEEPEIPVELRGRTHQVIAEEAHPTAARPAVEIRIADWMDALYDVQDTLMVAVEDDVD